ncbi:hypothetical protein FTO70_00155 [Methanosarcina sp. KYL-1]|nr:hypothetical protein [Methanosarcina sp. KYL-1]
MSSEPQSFQFILVFQSINFQSINFQSINFQSINFQSINFQSINFQSINFQSINFQSISFQSISFQSINFQSISFQSISFQSIILPPEPPRKNRNRRSGFLRQTRISGRSSLFPAPQAAGSLAPRHPWRLQRAAC